MSADCGSNKKFQARTGPEFWGHIVIYIIIKPVTNRFMNPGTFPVAGEVAALHSLENCVAPAVSI